MFRAGNPGQLSTRNMPYDVEISTSIDDREIPGQSLTPLQTERMLGALSAAHRGYQFEVIGSDPAVLFVSRGQDNTEMPLRLPPPCDVIMAATLALRGSVVVNPLPSSY
jgi:hypothetical protein